MVKLVRTEETPLSKTSARVRSQLLEAAGEIFAEKGLQGATSRDICSRAGVNSAAVNYHFGGFEALYVATLKEAHRRADFIEPMTKDALRRISAEDKLRSVIRNLVGRLATSTRKSWEIRIISREMVMPTFAQAEFVATSVEPRRALLRSIVGEIIGRPSNDLLVAHCLFTLIAPCIMLSIVDRATLATLMPDMDEEGEHVADLIAHVERFVFAGLDGVIRTSKPRARHVKMRRRGQRRTPDL